jgi:predicted membrane chloride channel (bestrophin family)
MAEMIACQKTNQDEKIIVYGIVSTCIFWQFGKLEKSVFTKNLNSYSIDNLQKILGNLDYVFAACEKQIQSS